MDEPSSRGRPPYSDARPWPCSRAAAPSGARSSRIEVQDLSVVKQLDASSPDLARHCAEGTHIPRVTLRACSDETCAQTYFQYELEDVVVSAYQPGGAAEGGGCLPVEELRFNFGKVKLNYVEQEQTVELRRTGRKWDVLPPGIGGGT
jgi:type VI secretion system secreted protein Hcp